MKIYRAWSNSNHKIQYTFGHFTNKETAEKVLFSYTGGRTASDPDFGVEEIDVLEIKPEEIKLEQCHICYQTFPHHRFYCSAGKGCDAAGCDFCK